MLDSDLAKIYRVETKPLIGAVKGIKTGFQSSFAFALTTQNRTLRSQVATSNSIMVETWYLPVVFTPNKIIAMLSAVFCSNIAPAKVSIEIIKLLWRCADPLTNLHYSRMDQIELKQLQADQEVWGVIQSAR